MRGIAEAYGGISFVNALSAGVGCAAALDLRAHAEVELRPTRGTGAGRFAVPPDADSPLVRGALLGGLREFSPGVPVDAELTLRSQIPPARGLKSSSAVSCAVLLATARAAGASPSLEAVARLSAEVSREAGVSATGAFDDALAGLEGGVVVTDNPRGLVLRRDRVPPDWAAVLWIPRAPHRPSPEFATAFTRERGAGRAAAEAATRGEYLAAMGRNTDLVERVMGYAYRDLREELRRAGALASGVTGMGPTLASITPTEHAPGVLRALPAGSSDRMIASFAPPSNTRGRR